ncbi:MAG: hypothetical protein Q9208_004142 [Pyrenodesmia sp. 3 TL-2023]
MAEWEEFKVLIDEVFIEIGNVTKNEEIEAVLETQRKLHESSNIYYRGLRETHIQEARCADIGELAKTLEE